MQININQSQEVADNTITKLPRTKHEKTRKEHRRKNHQTYPKKKKSTEKKKLAKAGETKENLQYLITMRRKPNRRSRRRHKAQTISKTPLLSSSAPKKKKGIQHRLWPRNTALSMLLLTSTRKASKPKRNRQILAVLDFLFLCNKLMAVTSNLPFYSDD
jgi:hypothetical protein